VNVSAPHSAGLSRGGRPARHPIFVWMPAAVVAVGWFAFWWMLLGLQPATTPSQRPTVPRVTVLPGGDAGREFRSQALFALPSPQGFSSAALTNAIGTRPPLAAPVEPPVFLERVAARGLRSTAGLSPDVGPSVSVSLTGLPVRVAEAPVFPPPAATSQTIQVELSAGLAGQQFQSAEIPDDPRIRGDKDWEATAFIDVGADGRVRDVLLETPSQSDKLNSLLVRTLWRWRMAPADGPRSGRITLRWIGRPQRAEPGGSGVPP
jgi:hypothetical protein